MSNISIELDCAKAILKTYHQVHDTPNGQSRVLRPKTIPKSREHELEKELTLLKEKYTQLQDALSDRDERLARLDRQLLERSNNMAQLQEDFENAIYQLQNLKL